MLAHTTPAAVPKDAICGDTSYGVVRGAWVVEFYARYRSDLSKHLVNWDERFDCNRFAALFAAQAQVEYLVKTWHTRGAPKAAAIGEVWIEPESGQAHALVYVITEEGERLFEPQTGKWVDFKGKRIFLKI